MAQPLTGHVTAAERHSGCSGNSRTSPGHTARTQANTSGNALRQQSQNDDDDAEFLKDKTGADGRRERPLDDLMRLIKQRWQFRKNRALVVRGWYGPVACGRTGLVRRVVVRL